MNIKAAMRESGNALRAVAAERPQYDRTIREARWTEGQVTIVAAGKLICAARAGAEALEWLLGWPAVAREAADFRSYSLPGMRPRSVVIAVSPNGDDDDVVEAASRAKKQGANVLALTSNPESPLARAAHAIFTLPSCAEEDSFFTGPLTGHAALLEIASTASRIFNPRNTESGSAGFDSLPGHIAAMEIHLSDPVRALAAQIKGLRRLVLSGGRFHQNAALEAAALARRITPQTVEALRLEEAAQFQPQALSPQDGFLFISGTHSRAKKAVHATASLLKASGATLYAATGVDDRDLTGLCDFSLLMPDLPEIPASLLSLALLQRLIAEFTLRS